LTRLLIEMTYNKVRDIIRHEHADRRDQRRVEAAGEQALESVAAHQDTASQIMAGKELLERVRALLSEEERYLLEQRRDGRDWVRHHAGRAAYETQPDDETCVPATRPRRGSR
jgi:hypothetical protein